MGDGRRVWRAGSGAGGGGADTMLRKSNAGGSNGSEPDHACEKEAGCEKEAARAVPADRSGGAGVREEEDRNSSECEYGVERRPVERWSIWGDHARGEGESCGVRWRRAGDSMLGFGRVTRRAAAGGAAGSGACFVAAGRGFVCARHSGHPRDARADGRIRVCANSRAVSKLAGFASVRTQSTRSVAASRQRGRKNRRPRRQGGGRFEKMGSVLDRRGDLQLGFN